MASVVLYDSQGFETSGGFTTTGGYTATATPTTPSPSIYGQGSPYWTYATSAGSTASTANIETATKYAGSQAVQFTRLASDPDSYYYPSSLPAAAATINGSANPVVEVNWEMNVTAGSLDPFIGISAFNGSDPLGYAGVDASTDNVEYSGAGNVLTSSSTYVTSGSWNFFRLLLNYNTQQEQLYVNGNFVEQSPFASGTTENGITDADISSFDTTAGGTLTAYFDNYSVAAVPEPASGTILVLAASVSMLRRRRPQTEKCEA